LVLRLQNREPFLQVFPDVDDLFDHEFLDILVVVDEGPVQHGVVASQSLDLIVDSC
jgi:hypothetical protein